MWLPGDSFCPGTRLTETVRPGDVDVACRRSKELEPVERREGCPAREEEIRLGQEPWGPAGTSYDDVAFAAAASRTAAASSFDVEATRCPAPAFQLVHRTDS